jgi:magnesium transporter
MLYANDGASPRQTMDPAARHSLSEAVWIDLLDPTDAERAAAERLTGLRVPSREDIAEIESSSRIYTEGNVLYLSMSYSYLGADGLSHASPVGFVLSGGHLLTLRFAELPAFETYARQFSHNAARQPTGAPGGPRSMAAFLGLAEAIVDRQADALEHVAVALDQLSKTTFRSEDGSHKRSVRRADRELRGILNRVGQCGDTLGNLRDSVIGIGRVIAYTQQTATDGRSPDQATRLATLRQDIASLNDYDQQLTTKVSFLLDAVLGFINIEQNNGVKVLTVVSVVGIPPTFVVGLYGMNFKNMPEYDWAYGYQYGWALILLSVVIPLVWFRVKGWI